MSLKRIATVTAGFLVALAIAVPGNVVFADQGADDATESSSSTSGSSSNDSTDDKSTESGSHSSGSNKTSESGRQNKAEDSATHKSDDTVRTTLASDDSKHSGRLDNAKKKVCENRQGNINTIMDRRVLWAERHITLFTAISERTQKFYAEQGKTLSNYDALVAAANSAKATAQANLATLKTAASFDCNSDDPKASITAYKAAFEAEKDSLKAYRTAVKALIIGVKSVQGEDN